MDVNTRMKRNVEALLRARGQTRRDLAEWCGRSQSWISKILNEDRREFPMKHFAAIAEFLGVEPYQLLQPGIASERRSGKDRRGGVTPDAHAPLERDAR